MTCVQIKKVVMDHSRGDLRFGWTCVCEYVANANRIDLQKSGFMFLLGWFPTNFTKRGLLKSGNVAQTWETYRCDHIKKTHTHTKVTFGTNNILI